ncbi:MarR family transcriptional regulator [Actinomadura sp. NPDC047616]|uniref:MarR family winged helix-turn-helix transcriptional regulator n=1 Tax=Actinomadura sp. NPDC047616 TaxID=3155914 RepID=UPI0033F22181
MENWELDVLTTLRRSGPPYELTPGALLRAAMVTSGAITNRIDRMEAKGLVERVPGSGDRRSVRIRLTRRGHEVLDEVFPHAIEQGERLLAVLDDDERENLVNALRSLLESMGDTSLD